LKLKTKLFSIGRVAAFCSVNRLTVLKWVEEGRLESYKLPSGHLRVSQEALIDFLKQYKMPVPHELKSMKRKILLLSADLELASFLQQALQGYRDFIFEIKMSSDLVEALFLMGLEEPDLLVFDQRIKGISQQEVEKALLRLPQYGKLNYLVFAGLPLEEADAQVLYKPWPLEKVKVLLKGMAS
jgi:excisionase family DNA binding protein